MSTYAIGDIHGCLRPLERLLDHLSPGGADTLILLGDYVDRGPDSKGVLDRVIQLVEQGAIALRGNHELMMAEARHCRSADANWRHVGGRQTLASYGPDAGIDAVPEEHWALLERLHPYHETDEHIFVHAGLYPHLPVADQTPLYLFWERLDPDAMPHLSGKRVVCGHTRLLDGLPWDGGHQVCIDTSAYAGGWLTCLDVDSDRFWQADLQGRLREGTLGSEATPLD